MRTSYITAKEITPDLQFVVMGCDGVYEIKTNQEIADLVYKEATGNPSAKLTDVAATLLEAIISPDCMKTGGVGCDNMTCIVIKFKHS